MSIPLQINLSTGFDRPRQGQNSNFNSFSFTHSWLAFPRMFKSRFWRPGDTGEINILSSSIALIIDNKLLHKRKQSIEFLIRFVKVDSIFRIFRLQMSPPFNAR